MMAKTRLEVFLRTARDELEIGVAEAEAELDALQQRQDELRALIAQAKAALGDNAPGSRGPAKALTLHDAIALILEERGNERMSARAITDEVNRRDLYRKRDGSPVEVNQVHARTKNYREMFDKSSAGIRLRTP